MSDVFATIGDNTEPDSLIAGTALEFHLVTEYAENLERAKALLAKGELYTEITDDQADSDATEFMVKLRACWKTGENARTDEKAPYDAAAGLVHAWFKTGILDPLTELGKRINAASTKFKVEKANAERREREAAAKKAREEEAARQAEAAAAEAAACELERSAARKRNAEAITAAEAEAAIARQRADDARAANEKAALERAETERAASASMAELSRSRGARGGVSSLRSKIAHRDLNRDEIDLEALRPYLSDKALAQAVDAWIDANKGACQKAVKGGAQPLKGVVIEERFDNAGRA